MLNISIGDINGIGLELALKAHKDIVRFCKPCYFVHREIVESGAKMLNLPIPSDFNCIENFPKLKGSIQPASISANAGKYSFESFMCALDSAKNQQRALLTLPIHKKAWQLAGINFIGHTDALSKHFKQKAIMMLGCEKMFVALFTEHIALSRVKSHIKPKKLYTFLLRFAKSVNLHSPCCVLGLNPHCGDDGLMGSEDSIITDAVSAANATLGENIFFGAYPPDSAFTPFNRAKFTYFVSMYHDVGLAPLKALYFEQSINVSLNLPILRTCPDHGVAFDKAYKNATISTQSYINAAKYATKGLKLA